MAPRRLATAAGFANLLPGSVVDLSAADGVMRVRLQHVELEVPLADALVGDRVRIAIRAGDILLATKKPDGLSARNVLPGKIVALEEFSDASALVAELISTQARL